MSKPEEPFAQAVLLYLILMKAKDELHRAEGEDLKTVSDVVSAFLDGFGLTLQLWFMERGAEWCIEEMERILVKEGVTREDFDRKVEETVTELISDGISTHLPS